MSSRIIYATMISFAILLNGACYAPCLGSINDGSNVSATQSHIKACYVLPCIGTSSGKNAYNCAFSKEGLPADIVPTIESMETKYLNMDHRKDLLAHLVGLDISKANSLLGVGKWPEYIPNLTPFPDSSEKLIFKEGNQSVEYAEKTYFMIDTNYAHLLEYKAPHIHWKICAPWMIMPSSPMIVNDHIIYIGYNALVIINKTSGEIEEQHDLKEISLVTDIPYIQNRFMLIPSAVLKGSLQNAQYQNVVLILEVSL